MVRFLLCFSHSFLYGTGVVVGYNAPMENQPTLKPLKLKSETIENLYTFSEILKKSPEQILEDALNAYFAEVQKQFMEKNMMDENAQTNLSYEEFWDGVDL